MKDTHPIVLAPDITIAELLHRYPSLIGVFLRHRMACVGCDLSRFETLGDALHTYNLGWDAFTAEVQAALAGQGGDGKDLTAREDAPGKEDLTGLKDL